jgi:uncharacterized protein with NAD-binding domain and iron-sulfur cluster
MEKKKKKLAVIGGGLSAMTALYTLSQQPGFENDYDVTVYQLGWRLGGKGASGVNRETGFRIEEHGLHLWMGFYENAFTMMRKCYDELGRKPDQPLHNFDTAFKGRPYMIFDEYIEGKWLDWQINFPPLEGVPGDGKVMTMEELLQSIFNDLAHHVKLWLDSHKDHKAHAIPADGHWHLIPEKLREFFHKAEDKVENTIENAIIKLILAVGKMFAELAVWKEEFFPHHITLLDKIKKWMWDIIGDLVYKDHTARRLWFTIDLMTTILRGVLYDKVMQVQDNKIVMDFDRINDIDYIDWLKKHGADPNLTIPCPLVRAMYDGPFSFVQGNINQPNVEAGTILRIFLRLGFTCKQHVVFRMEAGMGDTIFTPIYECLTRHANVQVKFFHKALNLHLSADKKKIVSVDMQKQVDTIGDYNPFVPVNGLSCWPSEPKFELLDIKQAAALQKDHINLESSWSAWKGVGDFTLKLGADFDEIILGASVESVKEISSELIAVNENWAAMAQKIKTVQTQAFQWWMNKSPQELGVQPEKLLSTYVEPQDTFAEMNHLLPREDWPVGYEPKYLAYVCGVLQDADVIPPYTDTNFPEQEKERVFQSMKSFFDVYVQHLLPGAYNANQFDFNTLIDLKDTTGLDRLRAQYYRANIDPSERYVLSVAGSSEYRLTTHDHGFDNLFVTGDWIQNGLNAGFVEGAVVSGLLTARAVSGDSKIPIVFPEWDLSYIHKKA